MKINGNAADCMASLFLSNFKVTFQDEMSVFDNFRRFNEKQQF